MNTLNKSQVKRLAYCLELAKIKHGSELNHNNGYRYYVDSKNSYHTLEDSIHKNIFISHFTTYNMWSISFNPLLSKNEINIILTKIEEELEK